MFAYRIISFIYFLISIEKIVSLFMSPPLEILSKLLHRPQTDMHLNFTVDIVCTYFVVLLTIGSIAFFLFQYGLQRLLFMVYNLFCCVIKI